MELNTVHSGGISRLYHWQKFNKDWLKQILSDRIIYCSDPAKFNDPWDGKPYFDTKLLQDPKEFERHVRYVSDAWQKHHPTAPEEAVKLFEHILHGDNTILQNIIEQTSETMWNELSTLFRIYCLGLDVGNLLMWSHYADGHKGICIEFDTSNEVIGTAYRVEYTRVYPVWRLNDTHQTFFHLLTKAFDWKYEQEYRLVAQEWDGTGNQVCLTTNESFLEIPENAVLSIIVGCNGPIEEIRSLVKELAPDIPVKKVKRVPNQYALEID